jgi:hypothetical protein
MSCHVPSDERNRPCVAPETAMSSLGQKIRHELSELIPVTVFFIIAFQLLALTQSLMLEQYGIRQSTFIAATIGALIVAKVVAISDHIPLVNRFPDKPLMYNIVWKTVIYFIASLLVRYAEHFIHFWRQTRDVAAANRRLFDEIVWPHFWGVQMWLVILLFVYCTLRELIRALGRERIMKIFFLGPAGGVHHDEGAGAHT